MAYVIEFTVVLHFPVFFYHAESQGGAIAAPNGDGALLALSKRFVITIFNSALIIRAHSW